jgi:hypothetical protein
MLYNFIRISKGHSDWIFVLILRPWKTGLQCVNTFNMATAH